LENRDALAIVQATVGGMNVDTRGAGTVLDDWPTRQRVQECVVGLTAHLQTSKDVSPGKNRENSENSSRAGLAISRTSRY
jgi:hypothetical protein